jgi:hypothetical protein
MHPSNNELIDRLHDARAALDSEILTAIQENRTVSANCMSRFEQLAGQLHAALRAKLRTDKTDLYLHTAQAKVFVACDIGDRYNGDSINCFPKKDNSIEFHTIRLSDIVSFQ